MSTLHYEAGIQQHLFEDWEAGNRELDLRFLEAMTRKDVDGLMSCFLDSPDLVLVIWGTELHGTEQVRAATSQLFRDFDTVELQIDRRSEFPSGEVVIAVGQATYRLTKAGEVKTVTEIWTDVRRKVAGRWVYVLDHAEVVPQ